MNRWHLMSIDEPISALEALDQSDERQRSPVSRFSRPFLKIVKLLAPAGAEFALNTIEAAVEWLNGRAESNREEFVKVFAEELKYCTGTIQRIIGENQAQQPSIEDELPGLTVEALRRAEACSAKERVAQLARILSHASTVGSRGGADATVDMIAGATRLSEIDILILRQAAVECHTETSANPREAQR